ncbi:hypothetical protein [Desulfatiferula olefinivorans]
MAVSGSFVLRAARSFEGFNGFDHRLVLVVLCHTWHIVSTFPGIGFITSCSPSIRHRDSICQQLLPPDRATACPFWKSLVFQPFSPIGPASRFAARPVKHTLAMKMSETKKDKKLLSTVAIILSIVGTLIILLILLFKPHSNDYIDIDHILQFGLLLCMIGTITGLFRRKYHNSLIAISIGIIGIIAFFSFMFYVLIRGV